MPVKAMVTELVEKMIQQDALPPYLYIASKTSFDPDKDWVFYSGPTWDGEELVAGVEAFLTGKWLVSGEGVAQFEKAFSQKYELASSVMVNSGSSANLVMVAALKKHFGLGGFGRGDCFAGRVSDNHSPTCAKQLEACFCGHHL